MFQTFIKTVENNHWRQNKFVLAVSGGLDSMCLALLFLKAKAYFAKSPHGIAGFDFVIAHCNFKLRGADSEADAAAVQEWSIANNIPFYQKNFDTSNVINTTGGNVQIVARQQRYEWFEWLRKDIGFDAIATAHHQQDSVETLLINFFKGTGISGMHGILPQQGRIARPLLAFTKEALTKFAHQNNLEWREDVSNQKTDYLRNKVRLQLLPEIEKIFPKAVAQLYQNTLRMAEVEQLYQQAIQKHKRKLIEQKGKDYYIPLRKLVQVQPLASILFELLKPFGLTTGQLNDALQLIDSHTGRYINLGAYRLIKNRNHFIITPIVAAESDHILIEQASISPIVLSQFEVNWQTIAAMPAIQNISKEAAYIDVSKLTFPLILRPWKAGDYLYPLGMGMKKKKVKKLLTDLKLPIHEREQVWVLESDKKLVWVCGIRIDERFSVEKNAKEILHLQFIKK